MAEAKQAEPSMEEILASIRRIIAEDGEAAPADGAAAAPAAVAPAPAPAPVAQDEVLELTEVVDDAGQPVAEPEPEPAPAPPRPEPVRAVPSLDLDDDDDRLVSAATAAASAATLAQLGGLRRKGDGALALGSGIITIEELVRDMLRPMLREWLDANLPSLVERIVREEVSRIVREAQGR
jgi:cell pole-organizing protein PopZ